MLTLFYSLIVLLISSFSLANVLGTMQTFAPNPDSLIFQNVHASQTIRKGYFNIGFFSAYVRNELSTYDDLTTPEYVPYKDRATTFDMILGWGATEHLELTYSLPGYFDQKPDAGQNNQHNISTGIHGHRLGLKYNFSDILNHGFAVLSSVDLTEARDNPYIGNSPSPIWNIELALDQLGKETGYGFNLGYRKRTPGSPTSTSYFLPISDQFIFSGAYVIGLSSLWRFHLELFGSYGLKKDNHPDQKHISSLEGLIGGKYRIVKNLWSHFGLTAELSPEGLAPDYRIYAGINYFFGPNAQEEQHKDILLDHRIHLEVIPNEIIVTPNGKQQITVLNGTAPYNFKLSKGLGTFDETNLEYTANQSVGEETLTVTDANGSRVSVPIKIENAITKQDLLPPPSGSFEVKPAETTVYVGGAVHFKTSDGLPPYRAKLDPALFGYFTNTELVYNAPLKPGTVKIQIEDQTGRRGTSIVHVIPVPTPAKTITLKSLNFIFNTNRLIKSSEKELQKNLENLSQVKIKKIIVIGHTDNIGTDKYNFILSQKRAEVVKRVLVSKFKLKASQIESLGYGESQPIANNNTEKGRLINRRVELKLYYEK